MKVILDLDQKTMDQQSTLVKAGVPGFTITNNATDLQLQMHLLDFIVRLSDENKNNSWIEKNNKTIFVLIDFISKDNKWHYFSTNLLQRN